MVELQIKTGRCTICKRMRIKVTMSFPQQGQSFINRSVTNPFVKQRTYSQMRTKTKLSGFAASSRARHNESLKLHTLEKCCRPNYRRYPDYIGIA